MPTPWPTNILTMPYLQHGPKGMAVSGAGPAAAGRRAVCALLWHDAVLKVACRAQQVLVFPQAGTRCPLTCAFRRWLQWCAQSA